MEVMDIGVADYFKQNEVRLNIFASKSFSIVCVLPYIILALVLLGIFNFSLALSILGVVYSSSLALLFFILSKKRAYASSFKYLLCLGIQTIILIYSGDCDMDITILYMMAPITALLYFNPKLEIITCVCSIISMFIGIIIQAPVTVQELYHDVTPLMFVLTTGGAHFVEMVVASAIFVTITILSRSLLNTVNMRNDEIKSIQNNLVFSFADMIESRDGTTGEHVKRTSKIVELIIEKISKDPDLYQEAFKDRELQLIAMSAPLHDIGKMKVPDAILSKPGKLTDEEFNIIKTHPLEGAKIIDKTMTNLEDPFYVGIARDMALYHHEKWNGKGYPKGLCGEEIPVSARIMAVADVFDALCSKRSYKDAFSMDDAYKIMNDSKGTHFEPALVDIINLLRPEMEEIYS